MGSLPNETLDPARGGAGARFGSGTMTAARGSAPPDARNERSLISTYVIVTMSHKYWLKPAADGRDVLEEGRRGPLARRESALRWAEQSQEELRGDEDAKQRETDEERVYCRHRARRRLVHRLLSRNPRSKRAGPNEGGGVTKLSGRDLPHS